MTSITQAPSDSTILEIVPEVTQPQSSSSANLNNADLPSTTSKTKTVWEKICEGFSNFFHIVPEEEIIINDHRVKEPGIVQAIERKFLNPAGYIPLVGTITGCLRLVLAALQLIVSLLSLALAIITAYFKPDFAKTCAKISGQQLFNYSNNLIRGLIEIIPGGGLGLKYLYDSHDGQRLPNLRTTENYLI